MNIEFNEDEKDFLQELLNVSFGKATAIISDMLDSFATLHIPKIELLNIDEIKDYINKNFDDKNEYVVFSQQFKGDMDGESIFIYDFESVKNLSDILNESEVTDVEEMIDISSEVINVVNTANVVNLANQLNKEVLFSKPSIKNLKSNEIVSVTNIKDYKTIIVVSTVLDLEKENIKGVLYMLLKPKTIELIKQEAELFFEEEE